MKHTYDTNIFIGRNPEVFRGSFYLPSVVLAELLAGAQDRERLKRLDVWRRVAISFNRLLMPDAEDWLQTGLVLQRLSQKSKRENFGSTPKISPEERVRLWNDTLLAVSCRRAGVVVVSDNAKDFERLSAACRVKFQSGDEFFAEVVA